MTNRREFMTLAGGVALSSFLPLGPAWAAGNAIKVGYNVATLANPFFQGMTKGVVDAAKQFPQMTLLNTNANGDANTQSTMVVDLINQGVDALILNPINANSIVPVVERAHKKNIPVFTLDRGAACGDCQNNFLETDNVAMGREGAQFVIETLKKRYGTVKGNVVDLVGLIGTTAGDDRDKGFMDVFNKAAAENPGLKLIARQEGKFDQETSFNLMSQIMAANPQIDAVFNGNDDNAVGAVRAIRQASRAVPMTDPKHIVVIGIDGTRQALAAIRKGDMDATLSQNPLAMAAQSVKYVDAFFNGDKASIPAHQFWPHILITKDNIDSDTVKTYGLWGEQV
ncbi:sugar ABC transporter substrate-binding protein [Lichenihabitans sp. Uapishka_5]|uniref:sugar ABC transporter substrate-binding protein n=1 Tax=Lichenihabitans sp. Uapishka_5 TaxID=3037302 RepID=UPI0029E7E653|nr:sugar ABC transporter substrate-binding protein [Lichenihabitans sp. Uapishka_5]MDX7952631.1 sugar ABC transporter substrate-binding protein [Lichenihabitans sp. Uapishka_5]